MFGLQLENASESIVDINDGVKYQVLSIGGLSPPAATIFTSKSPNRKGSKYNGSTLNERNIPIVIKLLGDIEKNRNDLYDWIDTESYLKVRYQNGLKNVYVEGYVQDSDIDLFTNNEVVSLVIICPEPYWKDLQEISTDIATLLKQFTFPFAIDSNGIPFSTLRDSNETNIFNSGAETGCQIRIVCSGDVDDLIIYDGNNTTNRFEFNTTLLNGWIVIIDTDGSPKTVKAYKLDGTTENLLRYTNNPTWFTLKHGNNIFGYSANCDDEDIEITVSFTNKYLGV